MWNWIRLSFIHLLSCRLWHVKTWGDQSIGQHDWFENQATFLPSAVIWHFVWEGHEAWLFAWMLNFLHGCWQKISYELWCACFNWSSILHVVPVVLIVMNDKSEVKRTLKEKKLWSQPSAAPYFSLFSCFLFVNIVIYGGINFIRISQMTKKYGFPVSDH